jgi:hypothetical protein
MVPVPVVFYFSMSGWDVVIARCKSGNGGFAREERVTRLGTLQVGRARVTPGVWL